MALSQQLIEQTTRHQLYIERLKAGEVNQFTAFLQQMDQELRERLASKVLTEFSRARLEQLLAQIEKALARIFEDYYDLLAGHLLELAEYEAEFEAKSLNQVLIGLEAAVPAMARVRSAINTQPLSVRGPDGGKLLDTFIKDWTSKEIKRVSGAIRMGYVEGQATAQIIRTIRGTKTNKYSDGILAIVDRDAKAIVRTAVQHVANNARAQTWAANDDIVIGYRWVSTLDSRTTPQCRALGQKAEVYQLGKGPVPPIHIACRSTTVAVLSSKYDFLDKGATRFARGPNGVEWVDADEGDYDWLKRQPMDYVASAIGPTRAKLLLSGGLSAERFAELSVTRNLQPADLQEIRRIEPNAFIRAGL